MAALLCVQAYCIRVYEYRILSSPSIGSVTTISLLCVDIILMYFPRFDTGVHIYRIERSPVIGKCRSPWVVKRLRGASDKDEIISSRLIAEANILR